MTDPAYYRRTGISELGMIAGNWQLSLSSRFQLATGNYWQAFLNWQSTGNWELKNVA